MFECLIAMTRKSRGVVAAERAATDRALSRAFVELQAGSSVAVFCRICLFGFGFGFVCFPFCSRRRCVWSNRALFAIRVRSHAGREWRHRRLALVEAAPDRHAPSLARNTDSPSTVV